MSRIVDPADISGSGHYATLIEMLEQLESDSEMVEPENLGYKGLDLEYPERNRVRQMVEEEFGPLLQEKGKDRREPV